MTQPQAGKTFFPGLDLDTFKIGGDTSPGQCRINKAPNLQRWEKRQGNGQGGGFVVPMGEDIPDIEIGIELWLPVHIPQWKSFASKWFKKAVATAPAALNALALSISHPILNLPPISITKVVYVSCTELQEDEYGLWTCTLGFMQFKPPFLASKKPTTTIPSAAVPQPTAEDAAQQTIQQQQGELQKLGDRLFPGGQ